MERQLRKSASPQDPDRFALKKNQSIHVFGRVCVSQSLLFFLLIIIKNHRVFVFAITIYKYTFKL